MPDSTDRSASGGLAPQRRVVPNLRVLDAVARRERELGAELDVDDMCVDLLFLAFLDIHAQVGVFQFGPLTIRLEPLKDELARNGPRPGSLDPTGGPDWFFPALERRLRVRGADRATDVDVLLTFMGAPDGLAARVFGELGVSPQRVERFAEGRGERAGGGAEEERLYSPEEAARYLGVHVKTVRAWISAGRLRASRLAGQRALRIRASDLHGLLEPVEPNQPER